MSAQTATYKANATAVPQYAFLAKPPPKRRAAAGSPLPCPAYSLPPPPQAVAVPQPPTPRSATFASIAAWAALVQPGSPAPRSPQRRSSLSRRSSVSLSHRRARSGSSSFVHLIDTQAISGTPSVANFDLTALGYTSVFVHLPKTPTTPSPLLKQYQVNHNRAGEPVPPKAGAASSVPLSANAAFSHIPIPPIPSDNASSKRKGMKRFRSLSILRPKAKVLQPAPASPTKSTLSVKSTFAGKKVAKSKIVSPTNSSNQSRAEVCAATIAKRKRAKYAYVRPPPTLANELAIMQFADGGNMESHVKRIMEAQAKAAAGSGASVGVADVYRDANGGIWWDADEELEYAHLLDGKGAPMDVDMEADVEMDWEEFDDGGVPAEPFSPFFNPPVSHTDSSNKENAAPVDVEPPTRRSSLSTVDSDLDPKYLVPLPENEDPKHAPIDDRVLVSRRIGGAGMSVLSLPARPKRRAMHLCKPAFLVDVGAWEAQGAVLVSSQISPTRAAKGKARRRPAPLKLTPASSSSRVVVHRGPSTTPLTASLVVPVVPAVVPAINLSPGGIERTRNEFINDSFAPEPVLAAVPRPSLTATLSFNDSMSVVMVSRPATPHSKATKSSSRLALGMKGLFRRGD